MRFSCTVNGDPDPSLEWLFNGVSFTPDKRRELKLRNGISTLTINNSCAKDIGDYAVVATNALGEIKHTANLTIEGLTRPEPTEPKKEVVER